MKTEKQLTDAIMRRVYGVYILRQISQPAVRIGSLLLLALALRELVWVSAIFDTIARKTDIVDFAHYAVSAFAGTEFTVQIVLILGAAIVAFSLKDVVGFRRTQFA
jgi:hypothetical protein